MLVIICILIWILFELVYLVKEIKAYIRTMQAATMEINTPIEYDFYKDILGNGEEV
jgi:hypothetical protein